MIYPNYTQQKQETQLNSPQRGRMICLEEPAPSPDWNAYPWAGILRCLYWAFRRDLPDLAEVAIQQFKKESERGLP